MTAPETERLFLAVPLDAASRAGLARHLEHDVAGGLPGRPVPAENWHLTVRFLGDTRADRRELLLRELRAGPLPAAFDLRFGGWGAFPRPARAGVLWIGVADGLDPLRSLAASAEEAARRAGYAAERRPFVGHLTLARLRPPADLRPMLSRLSPFDRGLSVREIVLYRSRTSGGAPRYEPVERVPLGRSTTP